MPTVTLKFICTKFSKSAKEQKSPWKTLLRGWMQLSCGEVRWWLMYHFVKKNQLLCVRGGPDIPSFFHTPNNAHRCDQCRIHIIGSGVLMAGNFLSIKSGSTYELWGWGFSPSIDQDEIWVFLLIFHYLFKCWLKNTDKITCGCTGL